MGLSQALFFLLAGSPAMIADGHKAHPYGGGMVPESNLIAPASSPSATFDRQVSLVALGLRILVILKGTACRATTKSTRKAGAWQAW